MKALIMSTILAFSMASFANEPQPAPQGGGEAKVMSRKEAKAECKKEGKKGKDLKACVEEKTKK